MTELYRPAAGGEATRNIQADVCMPTERGHLFCQNNICYVYCP